MTLLGNSLLFAGLATALALALGVVAALCLSSLSGLARAAGLGLTASALALPPFLATNCWLDLFGQTGSWRVWWTPELYSLRTAAVVMALLLWPVPALMTFGAWQKLDPAMLEAEPRCRGPRLMRRLLLPAAGPALAQATVLTFVLALNNFAVPALLQVKVFTAEIWLRFSTQFDYAGALLASLPVLLAPLLMLVWLGRRDVAWPRWQANLPAAQFRRSLGPAAVSVATTVAAFVALASVGLPLARLVSDPRTWTQLAPAVDAGGGAIATSGLLAAVTATVVLGAGILTRPLPLGGVAWMLFLLPGVLLGVSLIWLLNRPPLAAFYRGVGVLVLAFGLRYLALGRQGAVLAAQSLDRDLADAARLYGARGWRYFRLVLWPQSGPALAATWYLVYLLCLWDVETLVLIVPPGVETLALRVFNLLHYGHNPQVNALCLVLLALAALPPLLWVAGRAAGRWFAGRPPGRPRVTFTAVLAGAVVFMGAGCGSEPASGARLDSRFFSHVEIIGTRGKAPGEFNKPRALTVDREDNLYVVDLTGRVQKFAPDGSYLLAWQLPQTDLGKPKGMGIDADGRVVVIEPHYSRVNHFTTDGKLAHQWGDHGTNAGQLGLPRALTTNRLGEIWVCEYTASERVQRFTADGAKVLAGFGRFGGEPGEFNRPEGLAVDAQDQLYVADSCNHRVQVFAPDGGWLRAHGRAGTGAGEFSYPYDVRLDSAGHQFVCEFGNSRIQVFDAQDQPLETIGGPGAAPGRFSNPWSIALDSHGNLYVADAGNHRVQKLVRRVQPLLATTADGSPLSPLDCDGTGHWSLATDP